MAANYEIKRVFGKFGNQLKNQQRASTDRKRLENDLALEINFIDVIYIYMILVRKFKSN